MYLRAGDRWEAFQLQALHVDSDGRVDDVVGWFEPHLFRLADLPMALEDGSDGRAAKEDACAS
jgi:hypothetical protein